MSYGNLSKIKKAQQEYLLRPICPLYLRDYEKSVCPFGGCVNSTLQICLCQRFLSLSGYGCCAFGNAPDVMSYQGVCQTNFGHYSIELILPNDSDKFAYFS